PLGNATDPLRSRPDPPGSDDSVTAETVCIAGGRYDPISAAGLTGIMICVVACASGAGKPIGSVFQGTGSSGGAERRNCRQTDRFRVDFQRAGRDYRAD